MPKLRGIAIREGDPRVFWYNNPLLKNESSTTVEESSTTTEQAPPPNQQQGDGHAVVGDNAVVSGRWKYVLVVAALLILLIVIVALVILAVLLRGQKKRSSPHLPPSPTKLPKKSEKALASMAEEISSKDPFLWAGDDDVLWAPGNSVSLFFGIKLYEIADFHIFFKMRKVVVK
ncbi:hypothetical protein COOONC_24489 [Cooperia oncophora]